MCLCSTSCGSVSSLLFFLPSSPCICIFHFVFVLEIVYLALGLCMYFVFEIVYLAFCIWDSVFVYLSALYRFFSCLLVPKFSFIGSVLCISCLYRLQFIAQLWILQGVSAGLVLFALISGPRSVSFLTTIFTGFGLVSGDGFEHRRAVLI